MTDYKDKLNSFATRLKSESTLGPIQEVRPRVTKKTCNEEETQLNVWIPISLLKSLKKYSIEKDTTVKEFVIDAIKKQLEN